MFTFSDELTFGHRILTFNVPAHTHSIELTGTTVKKGLLYAYLYDSNKKLRANLMFEKRNTDVVISKDCASLGGFSGEIPEGDWQLQIYNLEGENRNPKAMSYAVEVNFNVPEKSLQVATELSCTKDNQIVFDYDKQKRAGAAWYKGDLHAHSQLSDGNNSLEAAGEIVEQQGLDFFFLTDHNICHPELPILKNTLILPSLEITTGKGHFNVHGARRGLNMFNADYRASALIEQGLTLGDGEPCNISVNHPAMKPWHWVYSEMLLTNINTLEVCCDPTWPTSPKATEEALEIFTEIWKSGHCIAAVGGSDSHLEPHERYANATVPSIYGDPATFVYAQGLSGNAIINGLRSGNVYLERQCQLDFTINNGDFLPGQDVGNECIDFMLAVKDESIAYYAECFIDGKIVAYYPLSTKSLHIQFDMSEHAWVRFDIRRGECIDGKVACRGEFEGVINPIYNGTHRLFKEPLVATWSELMVRVEHNREPLATKPSKYKN
ncbi:hypothetical protein PCNPT3_12340 [Psychromonas sp. CNPT3]|uniref:CehA/McbA family metallohydrolase n=1 Tax=Psychromonas sp. CNPT3 TaxID=314282 RepID=UPI00006E8921|nr:CehA/McbA family metallohydrolase [Psychromonas sp. CNPT3]AGH82404.1 hypothetical protein PCNPT3_12340 [Psychromonas sp. CNPT3]